MWLNLRVNEYNDGDWERLVNSNNILYIRQTTEATVIHFNNGAQIRVRESAEQIKQMLKCGQDSS